MADELDYASAVVGGGTVDEGDGGYDGSQDQIDDVDEGQDQPTEPEGKDQLQLTPEQQIAFQKRLNQERAKLEEKLRPELEKKLREELLKEIQQVKEPWTATEAQKFQQQLQQVNLQQIQQQFLQALQQDPVGTLYQFNQALVKRALAPYEQQIKNSKWEKAVADFALTYANDPDLVEEDSPVVEYMNQYLQKYPEFRDSEDGLEAAYAWAKLKAGRNVAQEAVQRQKDQAQQINQAKSQARATGGQATSAEAGKMSDEDIASAYVEALRNIR